jgi:gamma-glutamylcyclotransferase (GGCT)/AIG2-like uncharacterized protein YtfP
MTMKVFCYGVFKRGNSHPRTWEYIGRRFIKDYTIYQHNMGGLAYARPSVGDTIEGDLYEIPDFEVYSNIDHIEGHPHWYRRTPARTNENEGCELYVLQSAIEQDSTYNNIGPRWPKEG